MKLRRRHYNSPVQILNVRPNLTMILAQQGTLTLSGHLCFGKTDRNQIHQNIRNKIVVNSKSYL